ncbi:MAG TPA: hypothetical protein VFL13_09585 [Candidatus Baltobacteraceae bacterium]|nr:hypothetical protein [Candidatus Baltobacteraceae bacterium]
MKLLGIAAALGAALALDACAHGGNSSLPGAASASQTQNIKASVEQMHIRSSFVAAKHPGYVAESPQSITWPSGISQSGEAPVPGGMFSIENQYNTTSNGRYVTVYAGSRKTDGQGVLLIVQRSSDLHTVSAVTDVVAPSSVRIESASNGQLQLRESQTGRAIVHDIPAL